MDPKYSKEVLTNHPTNVFDGNSFSGTPCLGIVESLRKRNEELNNDIMVMKRLVYMLNVELELRESASSNPAKQFIPFDLNPENDYLTNRDIRSIEPLLRAFEQTKKEKDELLSNFKQTFDEFSNRCKEIACENSSLRRELFEYKEKAESSLVEWKKLHDKFMLIEEHNQLLIRHVKLLLNKYKSVETIYQNNLKQFDAEKKVLNEKFESSKTELILLKGKLDILSNIKMQSAMENRSQQDTTFSSAVMTELKKMSAELRLHHTKEIQMLKTRLKTLESLKCDLEIKLATVTSERDHLLGYTSAIKSETRLINSKLETMENELQMAKKSEDDARFQLMKSMSFIQDLLCSQNLENFSEKSSANQNSNNLD